MILSKASPFEGPSFSRRNRLARLAWQMVWLLLFRPTPPPLHVWRCWLLPGVFYYASAFFCTKMAVFQLLMWLPTFLK